jgi:mRNA-degrading endonuclease RelE of RelBE toxin-antitoxin system
MKSIIRKILNNEINNNLHEGRPLSPKNKFAKEWLSQYNNLKKYKSGDGRFIYLADDNGKIMVSLDTQINETAVEWERVWTLLEKVFGKKEARRRIIGWLLDRYRLSNMGYVYDETSDMMGTIDDTDIPIDQESINEAIFSKNLDQLKRFFYNKWDKEKSEGKTPSIGDIAKFGLNRAKDEIIALYIEYMGYDTDNSKTKAIEKYLTTNVFTEKDITEMDNFSEGKISVTFYKVEFSENENEAVNYMDLDASFIVLEGSFYNSEDGETYHFSTGDNPFDDFVTYYEFKEEIEQVVESFVHRTLENFGFNTNRHFDYISVKW